MDTLESLLGIDPEDPKTKLAAELAEEHYDFIEKLVSARVRAGLSQQDVADSMGVTQPTVSAVERLGNDLKLSTIRRYALAVGAMVRYQVEPAVVSRDLAEVISLEDHRKGRRVHIHGRWPEESIPAYQYM
ncbi:helix-turn-helix domain-containing protein [Nesterenkonia sp. AY15]|uniref:helix-turn-helix transcriptional regulator n=1 Tax=Nesterenkonia sp. AY15 TaxID=2901139 RepID=UPI001F4D1764|nr:helix-turn-helix transcriptional regulator [Nesterenkonia sp. AY15]MCH8570334.1 helix-turn-helix domain-containing protein [Nesterenkonia sp. AY15]